jgi:hypothetical protein
MPFSYTPTFSGTQLGHKTRPWYTMKVKTTVYIPVMATVQQCSTYSDALWDVLYTWQLCHNGAVLEAQIFIRTC